MPKLRDIEKFTQPAYYSVHISWGELQHTLDRWSRKDDPSSSSLQLNPDFQRGHVWTQEQQIAYVEFGLRGGTGAEVILFNQPGWMGRWTSKDGTYSDFVLVDGLQRVTAVLGFLNNKIPAFGYKLSEYEDGLGFEPHFIFKVNNLETKAQVLKWYIELNSGGIVHSKEEIDRVREMLEREIK
jgi:hypothetical protein